MHVIKYYYCLLNNLYEKKYTGLIHVFHPIKYFYLDI